MQRTNKILLSMLILGSAVNITAGVNEMMPNEPMPTASKASQEVSTVLIKQAFGLLAPADTTFISAQMAFEKFCTEKQSNNVLLVAGQFFPGEAQYCKELGVYAEAQKFPFLAALFYNQASKCDSNHKPDLSEQVRVLGVSAVVTMLNDLNVQSEFIRNPKDLFTKKDAKNGKSCVEQANEIFKLVGSGFKDRADFMKAVYDYQKSVGGQSNVVQMFGDCFVNAK